jgi:hypothetical protein
VGNYVQKNIITFVLNMELNDSSIQQNGVVERWNHNHKDGQVYATEHVCSKTGFGIRQCSH